MPIGTSNLAGAGVAICDIKCGESGFEITDCDLKASGTPAKMRTDPFPLSYRRNTAIGGRCGNLFAVCLGIEVAEWAAKIQNKGVEHVTKNISVSSKSLRVNLVAAPGIDYGRARPTTAEERPALDKHTPAID
jgi:hypothetical protein